MFKTIQFAFIKTYNAGTGIFIIFLSLSLFLALASIVNIFTFKAIIDTVSGKSIFFGLSLIQLVIIRFVYEFIKKIIEGTVGYLWHLIGIRITQTLHSEYIDKIASLDLACFEQPMTVGLMNRAYSRFQFQFMLFMKSIVDTFGSFVELFVSISIFFMISPLFSFLIVISYCIPTLVRSKLAYGKFMIFRADDETRRQYGYASQIVNSRETLPELKLYDAFHFFKHRIFEIYKSYTERELSKEKTFLLFGTFADFIPIGIVAIFMYQISTQLLLGELTSGSFILFFTNVFVFSSGVLRLSQNLGQIHSDAPFISEIEEFFTIRPIINFPNISKKCFDEYKTKLKYPTIQLNHISFRYPNSKTDAIQDVSFTIPYGQNIALVGENGAGKSTIVKLLLRMYDPTSGIITINGIDIKELTEEFLFKIYSTLFQDFGKFYLTIRENLELAAGKKLSDDEIQSYLSFSSAWKYISALHNGIDTQLGPEYKDGVDLSGGEWQKLAIARAYAKHAPVLILDEPTSAVDAKSEMEIFDRLKNEMKQDTLLFISHRFSTIKDAKRIIVLEKGKLIEDGNHQELMKKNGTYAFLYSTQAERYQR